MSFCIKLLRLCFINSLLHHNASAELNDKHWDLSFRKNDSLSLPPNREQQHIDAIILEFVTSRIGAIPLGKVGEITRSAALVQT